MNGYLQRIIMIGIDEAGRGALAGPMVLAACKLNNAINNLNDSKKLSEKKREKLFEEIIQNSTYHIIFIDNFTIDELGISLSYKKALTEFKEHFKDYNDELLFDGNTDYKSGIKTQINADEIYPCVMAVSILAKVSRDRFMKNIINEYCFYKHKGYGTKLHKELIQKFGLSSLHRKSFCKNI
ncbi:ribonuclease HII [Campylobacter canadensis]|uniref:ribonuclease HII n=1 Tax=Campylobacter canadensis TaxID=449520 RepID=UPI001CCE8E16|nr:ribonuclease HII [Campylobacter canadensis]MBZ7994735.1 ribonuclease HII [Campylobacter canadensis]